MLATASNDGFIKMWKIHLKEARLETFVTLDLKSNSHAGSLFKFKKIIGEIVFVQSNQELESPILLGEVNTTARLTCLAVWKPSSVPQVDEEPTSEATTSKGGQLETQPVPSLIQ